MSASTKQISSHARPKHDHAEQKVLSHTTPALALVGNPGSGKSTILNGYARQPIFESGISIGGGLTEALKEHQVDGITLYDTPGLADIDRRKEAGQQLDDLLGRKVPIKVAFIITLERGRVRPEDRLTIELILNAIKQKNLNDRFGVIINQISKKIQDQLQNDHNKEAAVREALTGKYKTTHWTYVPYNRDLDDVSNGLLMNKNLYQFLSELPVTKDADSETIPIDTDEMEEKILKYGKEFADKEAMEREKLAEDKKKLSRTKDELAAKEAEQQRKEKDLLDQIKIEKQKAEAVRFEKLGDFKSHSAPTGSHTQVTHKPASASRTPPDSSNIERDRCRCEERVGVPMVETEGDEEVSRSRTISKEVAHGKKKAKDGRGSRK